MPIVVTAGSPASLKFSVIDFSNPASPIAVTPIFQGGCQVNQDGAKAYVGNLNGGQVQLFDISNPAKPAANGTAVTVLAGIGAIAIRGTRVAVGEATNTFKARICLVDFSLPGSPVILGNASTPLVSSVDPTGNTLAAISQLAFIGPDRVVASGPSNFIIAIADFTTPANATVTTFNPPTPPCLDADENVQRIVTGDTTASWVRLYDTSLRLLATANSTLNSVDYISLSGLLALAGSNNTFQVALIDFSATPPQVRTFDPQVGGGSCTVIKGTRGCCGAANGWNVKLFDLTASPPALLGAANTNVAGSIASLGMGTVAPVFSASPASLAFGAVKVGANASQTVTIRNTGNSPLSVTGIQSSSANFAVSQSSLTISPGTTSSLIVTFSPSAQAAFAGNLTMRTNDPNQATAIIPLSGTGALPRISVSPTSLNFGSAYAACQTARAALTIQNVGGVSLAVTSISTSGAPFAVTSASALIPPGGSSSVTVTFTPAVAGSANGSLAINSDDPANPQVTVALQGNGLPAPPPAIAVTPASVDFGSVVLGYGAKLLVKLTNTSPCQNLVSTLNTNGAPFYVYTAGSTPPPAPSTVQPVNATVGPQSSQQFIAYFWPTAPGPASGKLIITSNDPANPTVTVALSGTAVQFSPVYAQGDPGSGIGGYDLKSAADRAFAFDYDGTGRLDHLALYRPGTGTIWILKNTAGAFSPVYAQGDPGSGIGGYDLKSAADRAFAFDYDGTGRLDHLALYRPGTGTIWILKNTAGAFSPVYAQGDPGSGIGGYDLKSAADRAFAFDYDGTGRLDHLALYRPGTGTIWILKNTAGAFSPVYAQGDPGSGIGGYDLKSAADRAFAFDYDGTGRLDHLALYRPGTGTIWILKNTAGAFSPVYAQGDPGSGIGGYDLKSAADRAFAFDYDGTGRLDHLALYRPGTGTIWILKNTAGAFSPVYAQGDPGSGIGGYDLKSAADRAFAFDYDGTGRLDHLALYRPGTGTIWILKKV